MPRQKQHPWFRFYCETVRDRKLRRMTPTQRWVWVAVLTAARESCRPGWLLVGEGQPMDSIDLADVAAVKTHDVVKALDAMEAAAMLEQVDGVWHVTNWSDRQYESDSSTERVRRHRSEKQRRNVSQSLPVTTSDTETDTDTFLPSSGNSRAPVDNPGDGDEIPNETWKLYARLQLARQRGGAIANPGAWCRTTARNARTDPELAEQAARWWHDFDITAHHLAQCLIDGTAPRNAPRRVHVPVTRKEPHE